MRLGTSAQLGPYDTKMKPSFTKPALVTTWLPRHGWNFTATPGSGMRQNFSEVLQKMHFFNFLIPMCLRTQLPLGLAWETSLCSACLEQMHHTWMFHSSQCRELCISNSTFQQREKTLECNSAEIYTSKTFFLALIFPVHFFSIILTPVLF